MGEKTVFVTGATGYLGRALIPRLLARGFRVLALARRGSETRLPESSEAVTGDALDAATYRARVPRGATFVHLVGVAHPSPKKARQFRDVDLASLQEALAAAVPAGVSHFVYLSVAHPAPTMKAYWEARAEGESLLVATGLPATILRPWYVLGPSHRWPYLLLPLYALLELLPATRDGARRLGLVTLGQMTSALVRAVEEPPRGVRIVTVPDIRAAAAV
ncbi:MAG TPA: NAD(P)H-binding protein [Thermoanaerobaculia bacterium]|nr:NAD(P)H-binding protein [Thermoanaerobaculia bacterium]